MFTKQKEQEANLFYPYHQSTSPLIEINSLRLFFTMGNDCIPAQKKTIQHIPSSQSPPSSLAPNPPRYGLFPDKQKKLILFKHAPLSNSQFLSHKFHSDRESPAEINLMCQIVQVKKDGQSLKIFIINASPVTLYVVVGGKPIRTETGLYLRIQKYSHLHSEKINSGCRNKDSGDMVGMSTGGKGGTIRVILQSRFKQNHSMFLVNTYNTSDDSFNLQRQQLQWNSLAFELGYIYGQAQQKITGKTINMDLCVVCQEEKVMCIFDPCRHMCLCRSCLKKYKKSYKVCPLCKIPYEKIIAYNQLKN